VLAAVEPHIRKTFFTDDNPDAKFWMGWLGSAFMLAYMVFSPVFGYLADRTSRWLLVGIGVAVWSLASGGTGLATMFSVLFVTRCFVGIGEAAYGPVAPSLISDLYPVSVRGKVLAWFYAAIPVGSALGYTLGGQIAGSPDAPDAASRWQLAFLVVVPPGLLLAVLCWFMREPPRGLVDATRPPKRGIRWADLMILVQTRSYVLCTLGMAAMTFALGGIGYWMPGYLAHRKAPPMHLNLLVAELTIEPVTAFGAMTALMGLVATLLGGITGDRLRPRISGSYFLVSGVAMLLAVPFIFLFLESPFPWAWWPMTGAVFCLFFNTGPTNTVLANVSHPSIRATAFALNIFVIHALGDVISPPIMGLLIGKENRFELAFGLVAVMVLLGGVLWLMGMRFLARDTELAPTRISDH